MSSFNRNECPPSAGITVQFAPEYAKGEILNYEGCLSLPNYVGRVKRYQKIKVKYQNRYGDFLEVAPENEMARCFQHEIDHLNGILYIDKMTDEYVINNDTNERIFVKDLLEMTKKIKLAQKGRSPSMGTPRSQVL